MSKLEQLRVLRESNGRFGARLRAARPTITGAVATLPASLVPDGPGQASALPGATVEELAVNARVEALKARRLGHLVQVWFRPGDLATLDRLRGSLSRSAYLRLRSLTP